MRKVSFRLMENRFQIVCIRLILHKARDAHCCIPAFHFPVKCHRFFGWIYADVQPLRPYLFRTGTDQPKEVRPNPLPARISCHKKLQKVVIRTLRPKRLCLQQACLLYTSDAADE